VDLYISEEFEALFMLPEVFRKDLNPYTISMTAN
jgi:hypothetical protein